MSKTCQELLTAAQLCQNYPQADPDIGGIGIVVSFLASAWIALLLTLASYVAGCVPKQLLSSYDVFFMQIRSRDFPNWPRAFRKAVLVFSDQQIVTGIAILIAGFVNLNNGISVYHWHIITYLAWMSSNVHLTSLTFLRDYLHTNKSIRLWRISGMTILFVLLFAALLPSARGVWTDALWMQRIINLGGIRLAPSQSYNRDTDDCWTLQLPARCFWQPHMGALGNATNRKVSMDAVLSYMFLVSSYIWKAATLFRPTSRFGTRWIYDMPLHHTRKALKRAATAWKSSSSNMTRARARLWYSLLMSIYLFIFATMEFLTSFAGSLWITTIGLIWGTIAVISPRIMLPSRVRDAENRWTFGQILPMLLLALPLLMMWEYFRRDKLDREHPGRGNALTRTLTFDLELQDTPSSSDRSPENEKVEITAEESETSPTQSLSNMHFPTGKVSDLILQPAFPDKHSVEAFNKFIYESKFFRALLVLTLSSLVGLSVGACYYESVGSTAAYEWLILALVMPGLAGSFLLMFGFASLSSRLYR